MSLIRKSGFLSPTPINKHPIIGALVRLLLPLMPLAFEYLEDYLRREKAKRAYEQEAARPMHRPLTIEEAFDVLAVNNNNNQKLNTLPIPLPADSEARKIAEKNFKKFFAMCQPEIAELNKEFFFPNNGTEAEGKNTEKKANNNTTGGIQRNDYLAGKFSGAYRLLVDENWDRNLKFPQQQQEWNNNNTQNSENYNQGQNAGSGPI